MQYAMNTELGDAYLGEVRQGLDGQLYQYTQVQDELGNLGFAWASLIPMAMKALPAVIRAGRRLAPAASRFARAALPIVAQTAQEVIPQITQGLGDIEETPQLGEVRQGSDGQLYQYTQVQDELGNLGFAWASLIPIAMQALPAVAQALPAVANVFGRLFSGGRRRRRRSRRLGELYGVDDELYGVEDELYGVEDELYGVEDELYGVEDELYGVDGELYGVEDELYGAEDELYGVEEELYGVEDELYGVEDELYGADFDDLAGDEDIDLGGPLYGDEEAELYGIDADLLDEFDGDELGFEDELAAVGDLEGYLQQSGHVRPSSYITGAPSPSPQFKAGEAPEMWKPLWS